MEKEIIAIDGPAASGKSTIAKIVAQRLGYKYIDSGAMYRCVALYLIENNIAVGDVSTCLDSIDIQFDTNNQVFLNNKNVSELIRNEDVTKLVSKVAANDSVRTKLVKMQQAYGIEKGIVMDGRDIGSVVFKDAKIKIFQVASVETRALRRHKENIQHNRASDLKAIESEIKQRDYDDMNRSISPLTKVSDAIELDSSGLSIEDNVNKVIEIFNEKVIK